MTKAPLTGNRQFRDDLVRIASLTVNDRIFEDYEFSNCRIIGPAVLIPLGSTGFVHCTWDGPDWDAIFWEIAPDRRTVIGAVGAKDCTFSNCTFTEVGIAGPSELKEKFQRAEKEGLA